MSHVSYIYFCDQPSEISHCMILRIIKIIKTCILHLFGRQLITMLFILLMMVVYRVYQHTCPFSSKVLLLASNHLLILNLLINKIHCKFYKPLLAATVINQNFFSNTSMTVLRTLYSCMFFIIVKTNVIFFK